MLDKYRDYFNINPDYFPQVNLKIINDNPNLWKMFYPHETFVRLLKDSISVISRKQKVSLWVEGAYGTGKSHAVLTLKKLLEAGEEDTKEYFDKFHEQLSNDLFNSLQQIKNSGQKILTVHRYGSSNIYNDDDLIFGIQQSIAKALNDENLSGGNKALKDSVINWLSQGWAKNTFNDLLKTEYTDLFGGDDVDTVISKLNTYTDEALEALMGRIMRVGKEKQFSALKISIDDLIDWIKEVIKENNLKAIVFIWDEFTEYFKNNMRALTGFQKIVDLSGSDPFYMIIVTHNVTHIFPESDKDWKKIMGRFFQPICNIELPENMAFRLMGKAMEISEDPVIQSKWFEDRNELYTRTNDTRILVKNKAKINDDELKNILPIHPYAALLLKHISSAFDSNQRSMFDFIKNDRGDEIKGFQWFIDNHGPYDENPLLTIDMLWDFFYEKGKEFLSHDIRSILDCFSFAKNKNLSNDEERVLKTVLLLQAISQKTGDSVELFIPNERNLNNAFEGSDLENGEAARIANRLVNLQVLFKRPLPGGKEQYSALINSVNTAELENKKKEMLQKPTAQLLQEMNVSEVFSLQGALRLRYDLSFVSKTDFRTKMNELKVKEESEDNKIIAVAAFAKDDAESVEIDKMIRNAMNDENCNFVFIDAARTPLGKDLLNQYAEAMSESAIHLKGDRGVANQYESNAKEILRKWRNKIADGEFIIYSSEYKNGERANTIDQVYTCLERINRNKYPQGLETFGTVNATMWNTNYLPSGVVCGAEQNLSGQYRSSNTQTKLDKYIGDDAWNVEEYWIKKPYLPISKMKIELKNLMDNAFEKSGQISIREVYSFFSDKNSKYGFMPCNLTAFVMGFLLKEYADGSFNYTDGIHNQPLTVDKLKEMVSDIIGSHMPNLSRYKSCKDTYIASMKPEEKKFNEASSRIFGIPLVNCVSVESTRDKIRQKMREWAFPIWVLKYNLDNLTLKTSADTVSNLIDLFGGIANNNNYAGRDTDKEIAIDIGKICLDNADIIDDMVLLVKDDMITKGMDCYLHTYSNGELISLAGEVGDNGQYINQLKEKFNVDAANWVWNTDTANQKIDEVIVEYKIIAESNKVLPKNTSFRTTVKEWCDRCSLIHISYLYAKNYWGSLSDFMEVLYTMKKLGNLPENQRNKFLELLSLYATDFNAFYNNQIEMFKRSCSYILDQFDDEEIGDIFKKLPSDMFTMEKKAYQSKVEETAEKYVNEQGIVKLRNIWKSKTASDSPMQWSKAHRTPILCMIDSKDIQNAKSAFYTLNKKHPDSESVRKATEFLESATFFNRLNDETAIDDAFRNTIVKQYSVMLEDLNEVRSRLEKVMSVDVYDWFGNPELERKLYDMADHKYTESGCEKALEKIDNMDVADVKQYLKELIRSNMVVGMEIIKGK